MGKVGPKPYSPKQQVVLGKEHGKNITNKMELSLHGDQQVPLCRGGLELLVGFPQQDHGHCEQQSRAAATGASNGEERQLPACSWLKTISPFLPSRKHTALGFRSEFHLAGVLLHHMEPRSQGWVCQEKPPEVARALGWARTCTLHFSSRHPHGRWWGTGLLWSPFSSNPKWLA